MRIQVSYLALGGLLPLLSLGSCTRSDEHGSHDKPHFAYEGEHGPSHWGDLSNDWALAKTGRQQSPIGINGAVTGSEAKLNLSYHSTPVHIVNNGHAVQVNYQDGSTLSIADDEYSLKQFHFHTPSEHTIDTKQSPMEAHLVHANAQGQLCVLGVMINEGAENPFLAKFWGKIPTHQGPVHRHNDISVNVADFLPSNLSTFRYSGSLTTPPCSEGVRWLLLETPVTASRAQIEKLQHITGKNARPVQSLNGRKIRSNR
jgi:carbonic anhydrase